MEKIKRSISKLEEAQKRAIKKRFENWGKHAKEYEQIRGQSQADEQKEQVE